MLSILQRLSEHQKFEIFSGTASRVYRLVLPIPTAEVVKLKPPPPVEANF